ncbi:hypothetical protein, partial [Escherichia coli]|uniref:hypothetical protein n=1 Tax=Escherichia coli TaxID=562 RepID=UPI002897F000
GKFFTQRLQDNRQSKLRSVEVIFPCDTIDIVELPVSYPADVFSTPKRLAIRRAPSCLER